MDMLLTSTETADVLRMREHTLRKWRCRGKGPSYVRLGDRAIRYRFSAVNAFIRQGEQ